jgi:hypothetical protein
LAWLQHPKLSILCSCPARLISFQKCLLGFVGQIMGMNKRNTLWPTHLCSQNCAWAFGCIEVVLFTFLQTAVPNFEAFAVCNLLDSFFEDSLGFKTQPL